MSPGLLLFILLVVGVWAGDVAAANTTATPIGSNGYCLYFSRTTDIASIQVDSSRRVDFPKDAFTVALWVSPDISSAGKHANYSWRGNTQGYGTVLNYSAGVGGAGMSDDNMIAVSFSTKDANFTDAVALVASISPKAAGDSGILFENSNNNKHMIVDGTDQFAARPTGEWIHLALVFDGPARSVATYVNGTQLYRVSNYSVSSLGDVLQSAFVLGQDQDAIYGDFDAGQAFGGCMDDLLVWDVPLPGAEISDLVKGAAWPNQARMWGAWDFDTVTPDGKVPNQVVGGMPLILGEDISLSGGSLSMSAPNRVASTLVKSVSPHEVYVAVVGSNEPGFYERVLIPSVHISAMIASVGGICAIVNNQSVSVDHDALAENGCFSRTCICTWDLIDGGIFDLWLLTTTTLHLEQIEVTLSESTHGKQVWLDARATMTDFLGIPSDMWEYSMEIADGQLDGITLLDGGGNRGHQHALFNLPDAHNLVDTTRFLVRVVISFGAIRGETVIVVRFEPFDYIPAMSAGHTVLGREDEDLYIELGVAERNAVLGLRHVMLLRPPVRGTLYQHIQGEDGIGNSIQAFNPWRARADLVEMYVARVGRPDHSDFDSIDMDVFDSRLTFSTHFSSPGELEYPSWSILQLLGPPSEYRPAEPGFGYQESKTTFSFADVDGPHINCSVTHASPAAVQLCKLSPAYEHFDVAFAEPLYPVQVEIYENYNPGGVVEISALKDGTEWVRLWAGQPQLDLYGAGGAYADNTYRIFSPPLCEPSFATDALRIVVDSANTPGWQEYDAVKLIGTREPLDSTIHDHDGRVFYRPEPNLYGERVDSFTVSALDCGFRQNRESEQVTISITLDAVNDPPVAEGGDIVAVTDSNFVTVVLQGNDMLDDLDTQAAAPLSFIINDLGPFVWNAGGTGVGEVIQGSLVDTSNATSVAMVDIYYPAGVCMGGRVSFFAVDVDGARSSAPATITVRCAIFISASGGLTSVARGVLGGFFGTLMVVVGLLIWKRKSVGRWLMTRLRAATTGSSTLRLAVASKIVALVAHLGDLLSDLLAFASLLGRSSDQQYGLVIPYGVVAMVATAMSVYSLVLMVGVIRSMIGNFKEVRPTTRVETVAFQSYSAHDDSVRLSVMDALADSQRRSLVTNSAGGVTFDVDNSLDLLSDAALTHELAVIRREVPSRLIQAIMVLVEDIPMCVLNWIILYSDDNLKESGVFGASIMITMLSIGYKSSFFGRTYSLLKLQAKLTGIVVERKAITIRPAPSLTKCYQAGADIVGTN